MDEDFTVIVIENTDERGATRPSLAKNRQAVAHGFSHDDQKFSGSPGSGSPLDMVKKKFAELVFEQEIPPNEQVQLTHNCLAI